MVCLLILRSLSSMLRGLKAASSSRRRRGWKTNMSREWKKGDNEDEEEEEEDNEEDEEEKGECFSVDSLESGKGRKFTSKIKISTVPDR